MAKSAFLVKNYLPLSEPFIYSQLTHLSEFQAVVATERILNRELFPFDKIWCEADLTKWRRIASRLRYLLSGNYPGLTRFLKENEVAILHAHFGFQGYDMLKLARYLKLPLVTTFYGVDISALPRILSYRLRLEKLWNHGDGFIVLSDKMKQLAIELGAPAPKVHLLRIGVDLTRCFFHPREATTPVKILMCGRMVEKKGMEYGLKAFAKVCENRDDVILNIIGDGVLRPRIETLIKELSIESKVCLLGYQTHATYLDYLHMSHIFLAPSVTAVSGDSEGTPTVLMEAQATGLPVISTQHAAIDEVVLDRISGYLVPEKDVDGLAEKIELLINHPETWKEMGQKGQAHIEYNYNSVKQGKKLENIYKKIIG